MIINGSVACQDSLILNQEAVIDCRNHSDAQSSDCFVIGKTLSYITSPSFYQGQLVNDSNGLSLNLIAPRLIGWTNVDGTFVDGTYSEPRPFNPIEISYGIYALNDNTAKLEGYRFREPLNPKVGTFWANMETTSPVGPHMIQWLYKKDQSSLTVAVDQNFNVNVWGNQQPVYTTIYGPDNPVIAIPRTIDKYPGDTVLISLAPSGPLPGAPITYLWRKRGNNLTEGGRFTGTRTDTLTVTGLTLDDFTFYDCVISSVLVSTQAWVVRLDDSADPNNPLEALEDYPQGDPDGYYTY